MLENLDVAIYLNQIINKVDSNTYQWPISAIFQISKMFFLSTWHEQLGHLNIFGLQKYLKDLKIEYTDDITENFYCYACKLFKATKIYNCFSLQRKTEPFRYVHTDIVGALKPREFLDKLYFFTFTCNATCFTHVYTAKIKDE